MFKIYCIGATYKNKRYNNEDNYCAVNKYAELQHENEKFKVKSGDNKRCVFGVFDGLGGEDNGEVASYIGARILSCFDLRMDLSDFYSYANEQICSYRMESASKMSGTTAVLIDIFDGEYVCSNIGDSRAYIIRDNSITQLSHDHTSMQMMIDSGFMTKEDLKNSRHKNILSQCLGMKDEEVVISPYIGQREPLKDNDIFLICSDGLTGSIDDEELKEIILKTPKTDEITDILFEYAVKNGAKDNVTIMLLYIKKQTKITDKIIRRLKTVILK